MTIVCCEGWMRRVRVGGAQVSDFEAEVRAGGATELV